MKKLSLCPLFLLVLLILGCQTHKLNMGVEAFNRGQYDSAAEHWNQIAINGNPRAQYNLGLLWESGLGKTAKNPTEAAAWFAKSATQGFVPAMTKLAKIQADLNYKGTVIVLVCHGGPMGQ